MRLVLFDIPSARRADFYPLALSRPIWELRCGMTSLGEKLIARIGQSDVAGFVPGYMVDCYRLKTSWKINDPSSLAGDDLLLVNPRLKAGSFDIRPVGPSEVGVGDEDEVLYARVARPDIGRLKADGIESFLASARELLPKVHCALPRWRYIWELVLANPQQIREDFASSARSGIEGTVEQPAAVRGSKAGVYVARTAVVHPMVVIDAANGPVYIDEGAEIHPFTRIEGPCYVGRNSTLLGAKCREGNSIGPVCRIGGEIEESIIQGYSNKYHDGFLGHAYVGEWVNLGALTTNSDLKNDYTGVSVTLDGKHPIETGSPKVGSFIGDHTKTSIGTLLNTGSVVGAMCLIMASGKLLPKFLPSFAWFLEGVVTKGFGKGRLYQTARAAMSRRKCRWTDAEEAMWNAVFELTAPARDEAVRRGRKAMMR